MIVNATPFLQLPFHFEVGSMERELEHLLQFDWAAHYNKDCYSGTWSGLAFKSLSGMADDIRLGGSQAAGKIKATPALQFCPYFASVISSFSCPITSARLLRLRAGAHIKEHADGQLGYEDGNFRLHIPVQTNDDVEFILAGERLRMVPGSCWYTNVNHRHSVRNGGTSDRIHLVVDGVRNDWSDELFFSLAPPQELLATPSVPVMPGEEQRVIEELRRMGGPHVEEIIRSVLASQTDWNK